ncbi:7524_t:CDS:2, partial [Gigaspora margarita]
VDAPLWDETMQRPEFEGELVENDVEAYEDIGYAYMSLSANLSLEDLEVMQPSDE